MAVGNDLERTSQVHRLLAAASLQKLLPYLAIGALAAATVIVVGGEIERHIAGVESWIASLGALAPIAYAGLFVLGASLLVPDTVLCIVAGALFGLAGGTAVVAVGNLSAATLQYGLSRRLLRTRIERALGARPSLAAIQRAVHQDQLRLQVLLRLTPLNPATVSYLLGAAGVRYWSFLVACFALMPTVFVEVYFGWAGKHVVHMAAGDRETVVVHDVVLFGGLAACVVVMTLVSRTARRAVMQSVRENDGRSDPGDVASEAP